MKKLALALSLLSVGALPARAGIYYDIQQTASSATLRMVGVLKMYASAFSGPATIQLNSVDGGVTASSGNFTATGTKFSVTTSSGMYVGTNAAGGGGVYAAFFQAATNFYGSLVGNVTGNLTGVASQATIWDHTPTKCSVGSYPLGTDTGGNAANCTAAGIGDVTQAGANNMANGAGITFLSGSSVTINSGATANICYRVNYTSATAASSITFNGLASSTTYRVTFTFIQVTSGGFPFMRFNGDTGSNYRWAGQNVQDNTDDSYAQSAADSAIRISGNNSTPAGSYHVGEINITTPFTLPKIAFVRYQTSMINTAAYAENHGGGWYGGSAAMSSLTFQTSAGSMTGYWELWNCGAWKFQN